MSNYYRKQTIQNSLQFSCRKHSNSYYFINLQMPIAYTGFFFKDHVVLSKWSRNVIGNAYEALPFPDYCYSNMMVGRRNIN